METDVSGSARRTLIEAGIQTPLLLSARRMSAIHQSYKAISSSFISRFEMGAGEF
jgi:hypothetical protein